MSTLPASDAGGHGVAARVARNTSVRAVGELLGKFSSLILLAFLARAVGPDGLGVFVFALAWAELASLPIDTGLDRLLTRRVAGDRSAVDPTFFNVIVIKLLRVGPVFAVSWTLVWALGYDGETRIAVALMSVALMFDSVVYTVGALFIGVERGDLVGVVTLVQRLVAGTLGILAIVAGYGVTTVIGGYLVGSAVGVGVAFFLLYRRVLRPARVTDRAGRREIARASRAFAAQEMLASGLARFDAILLSILATPSVVGLYGAATGCSSRPSSSPAPCRARSPRCTPTWARMPGRRSRWSSRAR